jgi:hypothetical protein
MPCKGICSRYVEKHSTRSGGRYESGQKMCSSCNVFIKFEGKRCPCCASALRAKPRNSKGREKITNLKN